jgi:hypothetical protein
MSSLYAPIASFAASGVDGAVVDLREHTVEAAGVGCEVLAHAGDRGRVLLPAELLQFVEGIDGLGVHPFPLARVFGDLRRIGYVEEDVLLVAAQVERVRSRSDAYSMSFASRLRIVPTVPTICERPRSP